MTTDFDTKPCATCGEVFGRKPGIGQKTWDAYKNCSRACAAESYRQPKEPAEERFMRRVTIMQSGCWLWTASFTSTTGYGAFGADGKVANAHRWVYGQTFGEIEAGLVLHHACERRWCVNPFHLVPMTRARHNFIHRIPKGGHLVGAS